MSYLPMPSLAHIIACSASDSCDTAVPVPLLWRSAPAISRFCPVLGWRTKLQLFARRAAESNAFSVPDRNALWSRAEDLIVQAVAKHCTSDVLFSDVLFPDWSEVASELPGRSKHQCKERYRLADTVVKLTCISACNFSWLPFLTILARSHKRCRLGGFCTTYSL
jgi:hypothetical protein